jgi:hypothetical protein
VQEGGTEFGSKLAEHREALDALIPVLEEWDTQLGTFVSDIAVAIEEEQKALQRIEEILVHLLKKKDTNDANAESFGQVQYAGRLAEKITTSSSLKEIATTKVVGLSTMREQAMEQRKLMVSRATLIEQELVATSGLIRTNLRHEVAAARQNAATTPTRTAQRTAADQVTHSTPSGEESTKTRPYRCPRGATGEPTMLPLLGQNWPALADARGNSKTHQFYDPNQATPCTNRWSASTSR